MAGDDDMESIIRVTRELVLAEQDVATRTRDIKIREDELTRRRHELEARRADVKALLAGLEALVRGAGVGEPKSSRETASNVSRETAKHAPSTHKGLAPLARTSGTMVSQIYSVLETEPRLWTASEVADRLGMTGALDSVRTALSKMYARGLVARPTPGKYCSRTYEQEDVG